MMSRLAPFSQANQNPSPVGRILRHAPPPQALPQWTHCRTLLFRVGVFSGKARCFLYLQGKEEQQLALPAERSGTWGGDGVLRCFCSPHTGSALRWGLIHAVWKRKLSHTHSHTLLSSLRPLLPQGFIYSSNYNKQARTSRRGRFPCLHQHW